jgi:hypothetical protein
MEPLYWLKKSEIPKRNIDILDEIYDRSDNRVNLELEKE